MISVRLPDGSSRELPDGSSAADLAQSIGPGLAKAAVAAKVDGKVIDLSRPLTDGAEVALLTTKDEAALEVLRHSAAHLMADAICRVFPSAQLTIGPAIDDGFYYDIHLPEGKITPEDFPAIEAEMLKVAQAAHPFVRKVEGKDEGILETYMESGQGENVFKHELVEGIKARGEDLSFYQHGDFVDVCSGPHVPNTSFLEHVKLTSVSGAYWRADPAREQLVRVYGTAFFNKKDLKAHLHRIEEAKKRDHRILGRDLELFFFDPDAPGFPFFLPKGAMLFNKLADTMRKLLRRDGYQEVKTPLVLSETLWHTSGHYANYMENMFFTKQKVRDADGHEKTLEDADENRPMAVKPMNCPGHCLVFGSKGHSYQELPLRMAEMGLVHRRELSGVRHGLFRVQAFTQDDAHHYCTPEQIGGEVQMLINFFHEVYNMFDLGDVRIELSTRPEKSIGSDEMWERAESGLKTALDEKGIPYVVNPGDGAFYGPKIDFHIRDVIGRSWQCGTIQLDFSMPERFGLSYVGADGAKHTPVMLHRACYGSLERFLGIVIENYAGKFPMWLAPEQVRILPVSEKVEDYAAGLKDRLREAGLRVELDGSNERIGYKIRQATMAKVPYALVIGQKEADAGSLNVRSRDHGEWGEMSVEAFLDRVAPELEDGGKLPEAAAAAE